MEKAVNNRTGRFHLLLIFMLELLFFNLWQLIQTQYYTSRFILILNILCFSAQIYLTVSVFLGKRNWHLLGPMLALIIINIAGLAVLPGFDGMVYIQNPIMGSAMFNITDLPGGAAVALLTGLVFSGCLCALFVMALTGRGEKLWYIPGLVLLGLSLLEFLFYHAVGLINDSIMRYIGYGTPLKIFNESMVYVPAFLCMGQYIFRPVSAAPVCSSAQKEKGAAPCCPRCGRVLEPGSKFCGSCGLRVEAENIGAADSGAAAVTAARDSRPPELSGGIQPAAGAADAPSFGYALLSFFLPVVGLVLYLVWLDKTPLRAKSAGKGALIGVICSVVVFILFLILSLSLAGAMVHGYMY